MFSIGRRRFLAGCGAFALAADFGASLPAAAQDQIPAVLRVGLANQLPYAYLDSNSQLIGQSPDVLRAALRDRGVTRIDPVLAEFAALIPGLIAKRFDIICTGLFLKPQRCQVIAFGNPDSLSREGMLVKTGNPKNIHGLADVAANENVTVTVLRASVDVNYAKEANIPDARVLILPDLGDTFAAVKSGRADVVFASQLVLSSMLQKMNDPALELVEKFIDPLSNGKPVVDYAAMGFRKEDKMLRDAYNKGLGNLVASGEIISINKKWGLPDMLSPTTSTPTADQLCGA
jgi:polar amino acid transport system substrate-binding protein